MTIEDIKTELREIIELSDKATPAPWITPCGHLVGEDVTISHFVKDDDWEVEQRANKQLVKASRNLTPKMAKALLTNIEWLENDQAQDAFIVRHRATLRLETIRREWEVQE
jgi:hypothetical protein